MQKKPVSLLQAPLLLAAILSALLLIFTPAVHTEAAETIGQTSVTVSAGSTSVSVTATAVYGANKYRYQIATDSKFTDVIDFKNKAKLTIKFNDLVSGTTYYVRARAFSKNNGGKKVLGPWSNVVSVTTTSPVTVVEKKYVVNSDILSLVGLSMDQIKAKYSSSNYKESTLQGMRTLTVINPSMTLFFNNSGCMLITTTLSQLMGKTVPSMTAEGLVRELSMGTGANLGDCEEKTITSGTILNIEYTRSYNRISGMMMIISLGKSTDGKDYLYGSASEVQIFEDEGLAIR